MRQKLQHKGSNLEEKTTTESIYNTHNDDRVQIRGKITQIIILNQGK